MTRRPGAAGAFIFLALLAPGHSGPYPPAAQGGPGPRADEALKSLNEASRAAYRNAREEALRRTGPVILVEGDELVLRYGASRTVARFAPDVYHDLKAVSHVPLAVYALLRSCADGPVNDERLYDLKTYRERVAAARGGLGGRGLSADQLDRQDKIFQRSLEFLDGVIKSRRADAKALTEFTRGVRPLLDANAADAAAVQLDALHRQVTAWRETLTAEEWGRLTVIVMGTQLPRKDNLAVQYFARLLGEPGEGRRVVYAEALFDEAKALDLLGTRLVDTGVGTAFFDDPQRMYRDLLGDAAREHLGKMFKNQELPRK
jgi:hypothetical protein